VKQLQLHADRALRFQRHTRGAVLWRSCLEALEPRRLLSGNVVQWSGGLTGNSLYSNETILTPSNVNTTQFGLLTKITLPGGTGDQVYAQPLYMEAVPIAGQGTHNIVIVATELNNVYAYDTTTFALLWTTSLGTPIVHNAAGGPNFNNFTATLGVTGTPVIDPATDLMYLDSTQEPSTGVFIHKIFSINITNGATVNSMTLGNVTGGIVPKIPGTSSDAVGGMDPFTPQKELQRPGLTILNGVVYVAYGSYGDIDPYHGWVLGFSENSLAMTAVFDSTPNQIPGGPTGGTEAHDGEGSIWMSGAELSTDGTSLYFVSANGDFDADPAYGAYGNAAVKINVTNTTSANPGVNGWGLAVGDYFAPSNALTIGNYQIDLDLGTSGLVLLPTQGGANPNEAIFIGKQGVSYVLNLNNMGQYNPTSDNIPQEISLNGHGMWGTPTYFNGEMYYHASGDVLMAYSLTNGVLSSQPVAGSTAVINSEGATPVISSNGTANGVVWEITNGGNFNAYDATTLRQIFTASLGTTEHFSVPTVADGQVYAAGAGFLDIFGEKAAPFPGLPATPVAPAVSSALGDQLTVSWNATSIIDETGFVIQRSTDNLTFSQIGTAPVDATSFVDTGVTAGMTYFYRVQSINPLGSSNFSTVVSATAQMFTNPTDNYTFDAGSGTSAADSGTANITGTLTGSVSTPQWAGGYNGSALSFSGDGVFNSSTSQSAVQVTASGLSTTLQANATVAVWIKTTQTGSNDPTKAPAILGATRLNQTGISFPPPAVNVEDGDTDIRWGYIDASGHIGVAVDGYKLVPNPADKFGVVSTTAVNDGQWHFVAFTRNSTTGILQVFVDGVLQGTFVGDTGTKAATYNLIGAQLQESFSTNNSTVITTGANYFNGSIDGLRTYNQVLNSAEIALLATLPGSPTNFTAAPLSGTSAVLNWTNTPLPGTSVITPNVQIEYRVGTSGSFLPLLTVSGTLSSYTVTGLTAGTQYQFEIQEVDSAGGSDFTAPASVTPNFAQIVSRTVFYNDSFYDFNDPSANIFDAGATDGSKVALLPGQSANFQNYTNFDGGLTGISVDVANLYVSAGVSLSDFTFKTGNVSDTSSWTSITPDGMAIFPGAGSGGSTRIEFVWNRSDAVKNAWLQIGVLAGSDTNLAAGDTFYFGNAIGEIGNSPFDAKVTAVDVILTRVNAANGVGETDPYDINRDGNVDVNDENIALAHETTVLNAMQLITAPAAFSLVPADESAHPGSPGVGSAPPAITDSALSSPVIADVPTQVIVPTGASDPAPHASPVIHEKTAGTKGPAHSGTNSPAALPSTGNLPLIKTFRVHGLVRGVLLNANSLFSLITSRFR